VAKEPACEELLQKIQNLEIENKRLKGTEAGLIDREQRLIAFLNATTESMILTDKQGVILAINETAAERLGKTVNELLGVKVKDTVPPEIDSSRRKLVDQIFQSGKPVKYKDERAGRIYDNSLFPVLDGSGNVTAIATFTRDITESVKVEEDRKKIEEQLRQSQKMEAIGNLASGVAHDLNNILSGIVSYPEIILMELPEDSPLRKPINTIKESGERAAVIIQDLLALAGKGSPVSRILNLNDLITDLKRSHDFQRIKRYHPDVKVIFELEIPLPNIKGSSTQISKSILNLISYAAEAIEDRGRITVSTGNVYLDATRKGYREIIKKGNYVTLSIEDTGSGISENDLSRIFEPFYTNKIMGRSGTGLGMPVVWSTIKDHNGYIDIINTEDRGTTFVLYFPVTESGRTEKISQDVDAIRGKGESILVVDDVFEQREIACIILDKLGYSVSSVSSGEEAIDYLKRNHVDLVVLDMIMAPGIDGLETYKNIIGFKPEQKIIIASGYSETDKIKEIQRLGGSPYVKKPYSMIEIGEAVKEELQKNNILCPL
jgi:two-component system cell cycle sensor histidine kinase/response regulator CckA